MSNHSADELHSRLRLIHSNLPPTTLFLLLESFKSTTAIFNASSAQLQKQALSDEQIQRLQNTQLADIDRDLAWLKNKGHGVLFYDDPAFPKKLLTIGDPVFALFYIGDPDFLNQPQLAIVGSRSPSASGKQIAEDFAEHLSKAGITITSGLAYGIDAASHKGALNGVAGSVAVVANGLHSIYPKANTALAHSISQNGCIVSESPVGTEPHKGLFPRRNRIISGLSMGTLVVEAAIQSGSLITSRHAMEQGREVFAIPGSIHNPLSKGCHSLIKSGAKLVETASDILEELLPLVNSNSIRHTSAQTAQPENEHDLLPEQHAELDSSYLNLLKHMEFEPVAIDELVERSNLCASEIASMLLILELQGHVVSQNGRYTRTNLEITQIVAGANKI